jgi:hypothetical protein
MTKPDPNFIWGIADMLRGPYRPKEYGTVILPFTVLARLEAVLAPTKQAVLAAAKKYETSPDLVRQQMLKRASGQEFYNTSNFTLTTLGDPAKPPVMSPAMVAAAKAQKRALGRRKRQQAQREQDRYLKAHRVGLEADRPTELNASRRPTTSLQGGFTASGVGTPPQKPSNHEFEGSVVGKRTPKLLEPALRRRNRLLR